jgi:hypothetical protein
LFELQHNGEQYLNVVVKINGRFDFEAKTLSCGLLGSIAAAGCHPGKMRSILSEIHVLSEMDSRFRGNDEHMPARHPSSQVMRVYKTQLRVNLLSSRI